jgi:two-component sensor histidine kinase
MGTGKREIMKRPGKALFLLLLLAVNASLFWQLKKEFDGWRRRNNHYITRPLYGSPLESLNFFGIDKNGADILIGTFPEFQNAPKFKEILLFSPWEKTYKQMSFHLHLKVPRNRYYSSPIDVDGDGRAEIPLFWIEGRRLHLELRNFAGTVSARRELEPLSLPLPSDTISWNVFAITDIDLDGRLEILATISGEFFGLPRGIAAYDLETGRRKWDYLFGATPFQAEAVDINGDGLKEIIFSAWAPHNGVAYNGMNDDTSYLGVLDSTGRLLWQNETGGYFSEIRFAVADLDRDGGAEIVTARACHRQVDPDRGQIEVLRAGDGKARVTSSKPRVSFSRPFIRDIHEQPGLEIIVGDSAGTLAILDAKLRPLRQIAVGEPVEVLGLYPVGKTDAPLIIAGVGSGGSRLYDLSLNMVHANPPKMNASDGISVLPASQDKTRHLLLNTDQLYLISLNPDSRFPLTAMLFSCCTLVLAWILAFNALFFLWWREKAKRKAGGGGKNMEDSGWLTVTQEMVHRMKTPMTNILWEAEQLKTGLENMNDPGALPVAIKKTPDSLIGELKELKLMNRYLMKFLQMQSPKFKTTDLNPLLREVAEKYSRHLQGRIRFDLILDKNIPRLEVDEEQIAEVFVNIIENAIDALPEGGELEISSRWQPKNPRGAEIVFRDNGKGIDENQLKMIFTPNYTTKKEGFGIGLPVCQRIVAAHGGTIAVESQVGIGTRIAIFIPGGASATGKNE